MSKLPYMPFFPADYLLDTQPLSSATKGIWMDMICHLWRSPTRGEITLSPVQWLRLLRVRPGQFAKAYNELKLYGVCDCHTSSHGDVTVKSRRMSREESLRVTNRLRQEKHRESARLRQERLRHNGNVTPQSRPHNGDISESYSESESELIKEKSNVGLMPNGTQLWADAEGLLDFLNQRAGKHFQAHTPDGKRTKTVSMIHALLKKQYSSVQIKQVIANRWLKWGSDPKMQEYLRPSTLFRPSNFENYLGELGVPGL